MKYLPKILLTISIVAFLASLTPAGSDIHYGMLKPISAILFIVFFILNVLKKEVAGYDEEERAKIKFARGRGHKRATTAPVAVPAHAHGQPAVVVVH